ncbi:MAG: hypothetical protein KF681_05290 [Bdellovibrionaceae bacterium]|nr:hypothetical protein [Pseudobdellovibrionaceae bacterium]
MTKPLLAFLPLLFLAACSSAPKKTVQTKPEAPPRTLIFPYGSYQHLVHVAVKNPKNKGPSQMDFQGAFTFTGEQISLIALSGFGTTVFRVDENVQTSEVKVQTYVPALEKYEPRIRGYYAILRDVLTTPLAGTPAKAKILARTESGFPSEIEVPGDTGPIRARLGGYDENDIPKSVLITHPDFELDVKVQGYEI